MDSNKKVNDNIFKGFKIWMKKYTHNYCKGINVYLTFTNVLTLILNGLPYSVCFGTSKTLPYLYFISNLSITITKLLKSLKYFWK